MSRKRRVYQDDSDPLLEDSGEPIDGDSLHEPELWGSVRAESVLGEDRYSEEALPAPEPVVEEEVVISNTIYVKIIREVANGHSLVFDKEGEGYLIESIQLAPTSAWQPVDAALLEQPYRFEAELTERMPTEQHYRRHLWRQGIVYKEDLENPRNMRVFDNLLPRLS